MSHSINPQSCAPIGGEQGFAVFPCKVPTIIIIRQKSLESYYTVPFTPPLHPSLSTPRERSLFLAQPHSAPLRLPRIVQMLFRSMRRTIIKKKKGTMRRRDIPRRSNSRQIVAGHEETKGSGSVEQWRRECAASVRVEPREERIAMALRWEFPGRDNPGSEANFRKLLP